jgi:spermidine/putrescine transport system permease protein
MPTETSNSSHEAALGSTPKRLPFWQRAKHHINELLVTAPSFLWMVIFFLIPTLLIFALSFRSTAPGGGIGDTWTFHTWKTISNPSYPEIVWRTIWLSVVSTFLCIVISVPCAFAIARASRRIRHFLVGLIILPFWTSFLVRVFAWKTLLHPEGVISNLFISLGFIQPTEQLLYNSGAVLVVMVYTYLPFAILPLYAAAEKFDFSLIEAALDLGSTPLRAFVQIFVPGIKAGIYSATLMVLIPALGSYVVPDIVGGTDSEMVGSKIYQRAIPDRNLPHASALSALLFLGVLVPPFIAWCFIRRRNINITETEAVEAAITEENKRSKLKGGIKK